jgi:hypothetical protein
MTREQFRCLKRGDSVVAAGMVMTVDVANFRATGGLCFVVATGAGKNFYYKEDAADLLDVVNHII